MADLSTSGTELQRVAVLVSRQALRPTIRDEWVRKVVAAISALALKPVMLCSSVGMLAWDIITALASLHNMPMRLIIPEPASIEPRDLIASLEKRFELADKPVEFVILPAGKKGATALVQRDRAVIEAADMIYPISIRPGGSLETLIEQSGKPVRDNFVTAYDNVRRAVGYSINESSLSSELESLGDNYIIHWTRGINGCWPGEWETDLVRDIICSEQWPRGAYQTLRRILGMNKLLSSSRHMPGRVPTVSLSGLPPRAVSPLMRWRARYRQMSFEPYGIGLERKLAQELGIRRVKYHQQTETAHRGDTDFWLSQTVGQHTDWRSEDEYRFRGDLDLAALPTNRMLLFCRDAEEAKALQNDFGIRAIPFVA